MTRFGVLYRVLALSSMAVAAAWGQLTDPSTLFIGFGAGTTCATGTAHGCSIDPALSEGPTSQLDIFQNQGGSGILNNPLLLILGLPNTSTTTYNASTAPTITSVETFNPYTANTAGVTDTFGNAIAGTYGLMAPVSGAYLGNMNSGEIYSYLGLDQPVNNSNSFGNWAGADSSLNSIDATSFAIYVYALNAALGANGLVNINFASDLPNGAYAVGYDEDSSKIYGTPFTQAGLITQTDTPPVLQNAPEPESILLLGTIAAVIGATYRKRARTA